MEDEGGARRPSLTQSADRGGVPEGLVILKALSFKRRPFPSPASGDLSLALSRLRLPTVNLRWDLY